MFNETYDEYMRNILGDSGYNDMNSNMYINSNYEDNINIGYGEYNNSYPYTSKRQLETFYPEIYKIIYPMIKKACEENIIDIITPELINELTEEIYIAIETDNMINLNINLENKSLSNNTSEEKIQEERSASINQSNRNKSNINQNYNNRNYNYNYNQNRNQTQNRNEKSLKENIQYNRSNITRNRGLEDLIKILLIREVSQRPDYQYRRPTYRPLYTKPYRPNVYNQYPYPYSNRPIYNKYNLYEN